MRQGAAVRALRRLSGSGRAGRPTLFDARYECNSLHAPWWRSRARSGGQVFEQAIHLYDLALHLLGPAASATGQLANLCHRDVRGYTVEDTSAAVVRFRSGALGSLAATNCAVPGEWNNPFSVVCERVTARFRDANHAEFVFTGGPRPVVRAVDGSEDLHRAEILAFVRAVRGRGPNPAPVEEGLAGLELVDAVARSAAAGGRPLTLPRRMSGGEAP